MVSKAHSLGFTPILATGDNEVHHVDDRPHLIEREKEFSAHRYLVATNMKQYAVPAFFQLTPELVLARFLGPGAEVWNELGDNYEAAKLAFYQAHYPDLRPREKLHGFEELGWQWDAERRLQLRKQLPANSETELLFELQAFCNFMVGLAERPTALRRVAWCESASTS